MDFLRAHLYRYLGFLKLWFEFLFPAPNSGKLDTKGNPYYGISVSCFKCISRFIWIGSQKSKETV